MYFQFQSPFVSPPEVWGRRAGVPSRGDPSPCRRSPGKPGSHEPSPPMSPLHPPTPCARLEGAGVGSRQVRGEERVAGRMEARAAGSGRVRERKDPAPGPGSRVAPACRHSGFFVDWERLGVIVVGSTSGFTQAENVTSVVLPAHTWVRWVKQVSLYHRQSQKMETRGEEPSPKRCPDAAFGIMQSPQTTCQTRCHTADSKKSHSQFRFSTLLPSNTASLHVGPIFWWTAADKQG